jgi:hypothetical protein
VVSALDLLGMLFLVNLGSPQGNVFTHASEPGLKLGTSLLVWGRGKRLTWCCELECEPWISQYEATVDLNVQAARF